MNIFEEVKSHTDIKTAAEHFGLTVRNGMCSCPAHTDRTPSMKLYSDHFHCFSCGMHGDAIKLAQLILSCSPIDAALRRISASLPIMTSSRRTERTPAQLRTSAGLIAKRRKNVHTGFYLSTADTWRTAAQNMLPGHHRTPYTLCLCCPCISLNYTGTTGISSYITTQRSV